ncbi:NAD(P)H-binding protein [Fulvivirgaceae bacterium BMA10]|uniref:NAD(P)H-binding protein n=1 Tax=Splendidivirga corallicola TaxID=3051826 RepID=A0ABT8KPY1_9BACT|nr:NAD(P)H-binding protein [Fulvivirgaceae bacterium BMA10]
MKITIIGAGGNIGQRIAKEAATRGHELTLITSKSLDFFGFASADNIKVKSGDVFKTDQLSELLKGSDVVISAYAPPADNSELISKASSSLIEAAKKAKVRLIAVGGAGSLYVNDNTQLVDTPDFPEVYKTIALAHRTAMENLYYEETELNWTIASPSAYIFEGERTNQFRIGNNNLLTNEKGESAISMEDFAVGILNEVDEARFIKARFTIGY